MNNTDFFGLNGLVWWVGVVENREDPLEAGRVQVRIFGWHPEETTDLPEIALPWAQVLMPASSGPGLSGLGQSVHQLLPGSWVLGFFFDGNDAQYPIVVGVLPGWGEPKNPTNHNSINNNPMLPTPGNTTRQATGNKTTHDKPAGDPPKGKYAPSSQNENRLYPWPTAYQKKYSTAGVNDFPLSPHMSKAQQKAIFDIIAYGESKGNYTIENTSGSGAIGKYQFYKPAAWTALSRLYKGSTGSLSSKAKAVLDKFDRANIRDFSGLKSNRYDYPYGTKIASPLNKYWDQLAIGTHPVKSGGGTGVSIKSSYGGTYPKNYKQNSMYTTNDRAAMDAILGDPELQEHMAIEYARSVLDSIAIQTNLDIVESSKDDPGLLGSAVSAGWLAPVYAAKAVRSGGHYDWQDAQGISISMKWNVGRRAVLSQTPGTEEYNTVNNKKVKKNTPTPPTNKEVQNQETKKKFDLDKAIKFNSQTKLEVGKLYLDENGEDVFFTVLAGNRAKIIAAPHAPKLVGLTFPLNPTGERQAWR